MYILGMIGAFVVLSFFEPAAAAVIALDGLIRIVFPE